MFANPVSRCLTTALLFFVFSCAVPKPASSQPLRSQTGPYELEVLVDGVAARSYLHEGETYILGQAGDRYVLRIHNRSPRRIEAVVSVDGLDVIDGKPGDFTRKRGYLVPAYGQVDIDGWRLNAREAAAFRFGAIEDSYAARTGRARNVGVIGVAIFPERYVPVAPRPYIYRDEAPYGNRGARADDLGRASRESEAAPAPAAPKASGAADSASANLSGEGTSAPSKSAPSARAEARRSRSGLGTEFGEAVSSEIREVSFRRANPSQPAFLLGARYNDRTGLLALGIDVDDCLDTDLALRQSAQPFPVSGRRYARPPMGWRRDQ